MAENDVNATQTPIGSRIIGEGLNFAASEAYNLLRANIGLSFADKNTCKVIGVTSACPQEGKSLTTLNTAYAFAKSGKRVLLIDGDMRRPTVAKNLNLPLAPGLSNALTGDDVHIHAGVLHENLCVLLSGDIPPTPSELIGSERMRTLLKELSASFDYIFIDFPPITAVSDAITISDSVDGFVIVVRHGYTRKKTLIETLRQLELARARIVGLVYNGYSHKRGYYRSGKYYKSGYYHSNYYYSSKDN